MKDLLFLLLTLTTLSSCKNDDDSSSNPINQLPPKTTIGANTFGCLLDGAVFLPGIGGNPLDCTYQFVNGSYYFSLQANKENDDFNLILLAVSTNNLQIHAGNTYSLAENIPANAYGTYASAGIFSYTTTSAGIFSYTTTIETGELTITHLNEVNQTVSGTFWFNVKDHNGVLHEIREGRFDMQYSI